ncbi:hydroxymethylglutaryl-CoA synthase family protein [Noviherbaspirillum sedimenti]|uniref:Hydroxymethylglutaryl-CoA synthase family protein n=2 Tax=Noviherbaspirillum sedimenti TaxID=2320865 RepID=A0A3A3G9Q2_9BURK|nr:hydroxymethylglutaryl-CoA synthase family protein [Noviherbaspirillum sedimenti]
MQRAAIAAAHKWMAPSLKSLAKGHRAFCSWDEDSVTMAVEASRDALDNRDRAGIGKLYLSSTTMPFADLQHSAIVAGALNLSSACQTLDLGSTQRAGTSALMAALQNGGSDALLIASEQPKGKPGSIQEIGYGAGAAAFTLGSQNVIASLLGAASRTSFFVDHFRASDSDYNYVWEERWIRDEGYMKLVPDAVKAALKDAKVSAADISHFIMPSPMKGLADAVAKKLGVAAESVSDNLEENCGNTGSAHGLLMLAKVLEQATPGQIILVVGFGQGCDALVFQVTEAISKFKPRRGVSGALADAQVHDAYLRMLSYEGNIDLEWGMRAEKTVKTALTEQYRSSNQLASFMAGKCRCCQTLQFPQMPYCVNPECNASSENFDQVSLVDVPNSVLTYTADWLSYHPAPPLYVGFVQFENGARLLMETVEVGAAGLDVGTPLKVVFRIKDIDTTRGYPRYFWKTTPIEA